eukprot:gene3810-301_t
MAGKKKGLSLEEKCDKVEEYLRQHAIPFTLKELEKVLPKAKGVIWQSVQECLTILVAENRAEQEKVGIHSLFWSFPSQEINKLKADLKMKQLVR